MTSPTHKTAHNCTHSVCFLPFFAENEYEICMFPIK